MVFHCCLSRPPHPAGGSFRGFFIQISVALLAQAQLDILAQMPASSKKAKSKKIDNCRERKQNASAHKVLKRPKVAALVRKATAAARKRASQAAATQQEELTTEREVNQELRSTLRWCRARVKETEECAREAVRVEAVARRKADRLQGKISETKEKAKKEAEADVKDNTDRLEKRIAQLEKQTANLTKKLKETKDAKATEEGEKNLLLEVRRAFLKKASPESTNLYKSCEDAVLRPKRLKGGISSGCWGIM